MQEVFGVYGEYYDTFYSDKAYEEECDFVDEIFKRYAQGPVKTLLDAGCGTGWFSRKAMERGARVTEGLLGLAEGGAHLADFFDGALRRKCLDAVRFGCRYRTGENEQAAKHFDAAAQLGPPSAELLNDIGFNLFVMGRLPEAEAVFRQAIAADPQNRSARNNLGLVLGETRRYDESLAEFRRGGKGEAEAQANLAYAQTQAGDVAGARSSYHRALTLDKELKPAAEALVQLARQPQTHREGASASEIKTLPELARAGRTSNFFESVIERDRAAGRHRR